MLSNSSDVQVKKSNQYGVDYELKVPLAHRFYQMPTVIVDGYEEYDVFYQNSDDEYSKDIFTNLPTDVNESYALSSEPIDGIYISDHCPVVAFVEM